MTEIHYALDAQGNYQVAPGDIKLAKEHGIPENFPPAEIGMVVEQCGAKGLTFVGTPINLYLDVM